MRCLACRYDLRGQTVYRCPECGLLFDPGDPLTYLTADEGTLRGSIEAFLATWRRRWLRIGVILGLALFILAPALGSMRCPTCLYSSCSTFFKLRSAVQAWAVAREAGQSGSQFDLQAALPYLRPGYDRLSAAWHRVRLQFNFPLKLILMPTLGFCLVTYTAFRGASRCRAAVFLACAVTVFSCLGALAAFGAVIDRRHPPSYAYVDEFVFLEWDESTPIHHIIAYAKEPEPTGHRIVAFADGHADALTDREFHKSLAALGDALEIEGK